MPLPSTVPLFRPEAVSHRLGGAFGTVALPQSRTLALLVLAAVLAALGICTVIATAHYTRRIPAQGWLEYAPAQTRSTARQNGTVTQIWHRTGDQVTKGEPLLEMTMSRSSIETREIQAVVLEKLKAEREALISQLESERQLADAEARKLRVSIDSADGNIARLQDLAVITSQRLGLAQRNHERTKQAVEKGALARRSADETEDAYLAARTALIELQRTLTEEQDKLNSLRAQFAATPLQLDRRLSEIRRQLGDVDQRIADAGGFGSEVFVAATDGIVSSIGVQVGEYVVAGQTLASITPPGATLRAALLVPTRVSGFVEPDMEVTLRYEAFPYQKYGSFSGKVIAIDRLPLSPGDGRFPFEVHEPVHVVKVALDVQAIIAGAKQISLQPGMTLRGDIEQERKRIIEWLVDPLLSAVHQ